MSVCLTDMVLLYRVVYLVLGRFTTILGEGTSTLPRENAPRKNFPLPPQNKTSNFYFILNLKLKLCHRIQLPPSQVPLETSRGRSRQYTKYYLYQNINNDTRMEVETRGCSILMFELSRLLGQHDNNSISDQVQTKFIFLCYSSKKRVQSLLWQRLLRGVLSYFHSSFSYVILGQVRLSYFR